MTVKLVTGCDHVTMDHLHPVSMINFGKCVPSRNRDKLVLRLCSSRMPLWLEHFVQKR